MTGNPNHGDHGHFSSGPGGTNGQGSTHPNHPAHNTGVTGTMKTGHGIDLSAMAARSKPATSLRNPDVSGARRSNGISTHEMLRGKFNKY